MKLHTSKHSPHILTGIIAAAASFVLASSGSAQTNGVSAFPMNIDGSFSNGPGVGEWSDVTPSFFFSAPNVTANPLPSAAGANTALYAALGTAAGGPAGGEPTLHLLYDFLPRTNQFVAPGELVASVTFPVTLPTQQTGEKTNISVLFIGSQPRDLGSPGGGAGIVGGSFFDIFADLDLDGIGDVLASSLGLEGALGFGPSPLGAFDHLIVELGVSLRIPQGFGAPGGPFPGNGINPATGLYDPDPAFWGAAGGADGTLAGAGGAAGDLQSASTASFQIMPNGSTVVTPVLVPEPTSAVLLLAGLSAIAGRRRRS